MRRSRLTTFRCGLPIAEEPDPQALRKVNPPLRAERDRNALVRALREGIIEAVATDHAPHPAVEKSLAYDDAAPGMIGLETALATCITIGGMGGEWLATLVERLTVGPHRILGPASGVPEPRLQDRRIGDVHALRPEHGVDRRRRRRCSRAPATRRSWGQRFAAPSCSPWPAAASSIGIRRACRSRRSRSRMPDVRGRLALESGATYEGIALRRSARRRAATVRWSSTPA